MSGKLPLFNTPKLRGKYLDKVLASGHLTAGPMVEELERRLRERTGAGAVICTSSACAAWEAVLRVRAPDYVWVREDTFPVVHDMVAKFARGPDTCRIIKLSTSIGGREASWGEGLQWSIARGDWNVEDCCHIGFPRRGDLDLAFTSFYPTKLLAGAEGGALMIFKPAMGWHEELRRMVHCGFGGWPRDYLTRTPGAKLHMTDVNAALNLEALEGFDEYRDRVKEEWLKRARTIERVVDVSLQPYLLQVETSREWNRERWERVWKWPIQTAWNFPPNDRLTLPMWPGMSDGEWELVQKCVRSIEREAP